MLLPYNSKPKQTQFLITNSITHHHNSSNTNAITTTTASHYHTNILPHYDPTATTSATTTSTAVTTNRLPRTYGPSGNNSKSRRNGSTNANNNTPSKPIMVVCLVIATMSIALAISIFVQGNQEPVYPFGKPDPNLKLPVNLTDQIQYIYSTAIPSVGSKALEDMLVAHAVAYNEKKTYGGACSNSALDGIHQIPPDVQAQNEDLIRALGLQSELFYACPASNDTTAVVLTTDQYDYMNWRDTELMSPAWIQLLQQKMLTYPSPPKPKSSKKKKTISIVAHVQRGAVTPCVTEYARYLPNLHYQLILSQYTSSTSTFKNTITTNVTIISQSPSFESFHNFTASGYTLQLNRSIIDDWMEMIQADVLIMSRSSYSLVPALFNRNTVLYTHYWHEPLPTWKVVPVSITQQSGNAVVQLRANKCHNTTKGFVHVVSSSSGSSSSGTDDDTFQSGKTAAGVEQGV